MNKQQTAVEFLVELLPQIDWDDPYYRGILQEAKDMEKEQQFRFFIAGQLSMEEGGKDFEQYYTETYNK